MDVIRGFAVLAVATALTAGCASSSSSTAHHGGSVPPGGYPAQDATCPTRIAQNYVPPNGSQKQLLPVGADALSVCIYKRGTNDKQPRQLAATHAVPAAQVATDLAALNTLPEMTVMPDCLRIGPEPLLALSVGYLSGPDFVVPLVSPCATYFTNGPFDAGPNAAVTNDLGLTRYLVEQ